MGRPCDPCQRRSYVPEWAGRNSMVGGIRTCKRDTKRSYWLVQTDAKTPKEALSVQACMGIIATSESSRNGSISAGKHCTWLNAFPKRRSALLFCNRNYGAQQPPGRGTVEEMKGWKGARLIREDLLTCICSPFGPEDALLPCPKAALAPGRNL